MGHRPAELGLQEKRILMNIGTAALGSITVSPQASDVHCHQMPHRLEAGRDCDVLVDTDLKKRERESGRHI